MPWNYRAKLIGKFSLCHEKRRFPNIIICHIWRNSAAAPLSLATKPLPHKLRFSLAPPLLTTPFLIIAEKGLCNILNKTAQFFRHYNRPFITFHLFYQKTIKFVRPASLSCPVLLKIAPASIFPPAYTTPIFFQPK